MNKVVEKLLLDKTVGWFKGQGDKQKGKEGSGWVIKIVMAVAVMAFLAYASYSAWKRNKALAKAKHERDLAKEEAHRAKVDWELGEIDEKIEEKLKALEEANKKTEAFEKEVEKIQEETTYELFKIEAIKNWDDMGRYLDGLRGK